MTTDYEDRATSLGDLLRQSCEKWPDKAAIIHPTKQGRETIAYAELYERVFAFAGALHGLGLEKGDKVALFGENSLEWALADWASQTLGIVVVPIYPTLPPDQVRYIVADSGAKMLLAGSTVLFDKVKAHVPVPMALLRDGDDSIAALAKGHRFDRAEWIRALESVDRADVATIIYTSGTTGNPKGAVLQHKTFIHLCHSILANLPVDHTDTFLSFLPLSHVYERMAGHILPISLGATIAYAGSLATLANDMLQVRPTVVLCVPRFLEAMRERIMENAEKQPAVRRRLFHLALRQGLRKVRGQSAPLAGVLDGLVGAKVRERTGGRLKFLVSGGMALPLHTWEFFAAFGIKVLQGYGLTETCAATSVNHPDRIRPETVGEPIEGVEIRIAADGEILVRGPSVMLGYHNLPEATAEAIDLEGWFHTGDIGTYEDGYLKITDRKKDLIVLGNGKNVAPQPIENRLRESPYIAEAVLFGDGQPTVSALIVPDFVHVSTYCEQHGIKLVRPEQALEFDPVRKLIKSEIDKVNKGLADFEMVRKHELAPHRFSVESGELTPSLKVRRKVVREKYRDQIAKMMRS